MKEKIRQILKDYRYYADKAWAEIQVGVYTQKEYSVDLKDNEDERIAEIMFEVNKRFSIKAKKEKLR